MINKQLTYLVLLTGLVLLSFGCKKKDLPPIPYENNPVFNVVGTIDNETIDLHAGQNDAFMLTKIQSLNGVDQFTGLLSNGNTSMGIRFFDSKVDIPTLSGNFVALDNYEISAAYGTTPLLKISSGDFSNSSSIINIIWKIDGVEQSDSTLRIFEPGKYNVCAKIFFSNGQNATTCNSIVVGYQTNADFVLNWEIIQNEAIKAVIDAPNNTVASIKWFIDDVLLGESIELNHFNIPNTFRLKAEVKFQNGVVSTREVFVNKSADDYSIEDFVLIGQETNLKWDSSVHFTVEKNGITYQSVNGEINNSVFHITDISNYQSNGNGPNVKLLKGTLESPFSNTSTGGTVNGTFQIEIGVAY